MITKEDIITILKANKNYLRQKFSVEELALFGSYSRNEQGDQSDIDILVETSEPLGFEFVNLAYEIERLIDHSVDLVSKNSIKPKYLKEIEKDLIYV